VRRPAVQACLATPSPLEGVSYQARYLRVLIYTHSFAPAIGGAESYVYNLAELLARTPDRRVAVTLATPTAGGAFEDTTLPYTVIRQSSTLHLWRLIRASDVVHLSGPCLAPLLLALVQRKPVVVYHHGYQVCCPRGNLLYQPSGSWCPGQFMLRRYDLCIKCIAVTGGLRKGLQSTLLTLLRRFLCTRAVANLHTSDFTLNRLNIPHSHVIYHGVPCADDAARPLRHANDSPKTFVYVGRLVSEKGLPTLLRAGALLRDQNLSFQLRFIGDGPERAELARIVDEQHLEGHVTFVGFLRGDALQREVEAATALVMPSIWEETAGLAAVEHMMRGQLVIASDIGGLSELVGSAGLKFPAGDAVALAACMSRVITNPELAPTLGRAARERALRLFKTEKMLTEHLAIFERALETV